MADNYNTIVVGIDGSDAANIAFMEAVRIAKRNYAKLYVVQIINNVANYLPDSAVEELTIECDNLFKQLKENAQNIGFNDLFSIIQVGSTKKLLTMTIPSEVKADLIILGATSSHVISDSFTGSIAQFASRNAKCSVLIAR